MFQQICKHLEQRVKQINHCGIRCKSYRAQRKRYALDTVHSPLVFYMKIQLCSVYTRDLLIMRISPRDGYPWCSLVLVICFPLTSHIIQLDQWVPGRNKLGRVSRKTFGFLIKWEITNWHCSLLPSAHYAISFPKCWLKGPFYDKGKSRRKIYEVWRYAVHDYSPITSVLQTGYLWTPWYHITKCLLA